MLSVANFQIGDGLSFSGVTGQLTFLECLRYAFFPQFLLQEDTLRTKMQQSHCLTSTKRLDGTRLLGKFSLCFRFLNYLSLCTFFLLFGILLITLLCFLFRSAVAFR